MKKTIATLLGLTAAVTLSSCAASNNNFGYGGQPTGVVYSGYNTPGSIADSHVKPARTGEACTHGILWLVAWGHAGTDDAMQNGDITKLANVQYSNTSVLSGLYSKYCTIAAGE